MIIRPAILQPLEENELQCFNLHIEHFNPEADVLTTKEGNMNTMETGEEVLENFLIVVDFFLLQLKYCGLRIIKIEEYLKVKRNEIELAY